MHFLSETENTFDLMIHGMWSREDDVDLKSSNLVLEHSYSSEWDETASSLTELYAVEL
jgi:hypothetical protein